MEYYNTIPIAEVRTIFLDYDGTLHDSLKIYARAFKKAYAYLVKEGLAESGLIRKSVTGWVIMQKICGKISNRILDRNCGSIAAI